MAEIHVATSGPLVKELVDDVIAEIRHIERYAANQAAWSSTDPHKIADAAIYEIWTHLQDDLQIRLATTLASHGVTP